MRKEIRTAIQRSRETLLSDMVGAACLIVMLFVGLSLPGLS